MEWEAADRDSASQGGCAVDQAGTVVGDAAADGILLQGGCAVDQAETVVGDAAADGILLTIVSARDLRDAYWHWSDPYVLVEHVGKPRALFLTPVRNNTLHPVWNFTHEVEDFAHDDDLKFTVYDSNPGNSDDFLGCAKSLGLPRHSNTMELRLYIAGRATNAHLTIKIEPL